MTKLCRFVYTGQWVAAIALPLASVALLAAVVGDIPAGLALIACLPSMVLLAIPPICGRTAGRMRFADAITPFYAVATLAVWATYAVYWLSWVSPIAATSVMTIGGLLAVLLAAAWLGQLIVAIAARAAPAAVTGAPDDAVGR